jgi:Tol biopolymer transport system component
LVALVAFAIAAAGIVFAIIAFSRGPAATEAGDGQIVVFAPDSDGTLQLFTAGPGGKQLTHATGDVVQAEWASDGSAIAYAVVAGPELADVHVMGADGSNDRIACSGCAQVVSVGSSDGDSRTVVSREMTAIHVAPGGDRVRVAIFYGDIVIHDSSRPDEPVVINRGEDRRDEAFAWSPDGEHLAFASSGVGGPRDGIYVVNADGSQFRQVTHPVGPQYTHRPDSQPAWSPDGTRIAFTRYVAEFEPGSHLESPGRSDIWIVDLDGSPERQLTTAPQPEGTYGSTAPVWSPDGTEVAFLIDADPSGKDTGINETDIDVIGSDGTGLRTLFSCLEDDSFDRCPSPPDWSPGGGSLTFQGAYGTGPFVIPATGGEPRPLSDIEDACCVRWQPQA